MARKKQAKPYYSLLVMFEGESQYTPEFGSYDIGEVEDEKLEYSGQGYGVKIIRTSDLQSEITAEIYRINRRFA